MKKALSFVISLILLVSTCGIVTVSASAATFVEASVNSSDGALEIHKNYGFWSDGHFYSFDIIAGYGMNYADFFQDGDTITVVTSSGGKQNSIVFTKSTSNFKSADGAVLEIDSPTRYEGEIVINGNNAYMPLQISCDRIYSFKGILNLPVKVVAMEDGWHQREKWEYDEYYYYVKDGQMLKGWQLLDGKWYYFNDEGFTVFESYRKLIGNKVYAFNDDGTLIDKGNYKRSAVTLDFRKANPKGELRLPWSEAIPAIIALNDKRLIDHPGESEMLSPDNARWIMQNDGLFDPSFSPTLDDSYCIMDYPGGGDIAIYPDNNECVFAFIINPYHSPEKAYSFSLPDNPYRGIEYASSVKIIARVSCWENHNGTWSYYDANGFCVKGWQKINKKWYYFNGSGKMLTGWVKSNGKWYYMTTSGDMVTGWKKISNKWYYFNSSGTMVTGWQKVSGKWYYFDASGAMKTGWLKSGGKWYYLDSSGAMLANTSRKIGNKTYKFNSSGVCTNP